MGEKKPMMPFESSSHMKKMHRPPYMPFHHRPHRHRQHHYHHPKEPFFVERIHRFLGHRCEVATDCKTLKGVLKEVAQDYITLRVDGRECCIRIKMICFICPIMDP
ncbi:DUF2642 domain-containing protein [Numidum massiliense]|uniref:DUF2642 domain-containing protein n=1 Tax=Numidum massiliense TaxID=1522315 RepID=UPI0006D542D6|nr:DUF2642 domain-containing protein [Numidum massiliense]